MKDISPVDPRMSRSAAPMDLETLILSDGTNYTKKMSIPYDTGPDLFGHTYEIQTADSLPRVPTATKTSLSDVADTSFGPNQKVARL